MILYRFSTRALLTRHLGNTAHLIRVRHLPAPMRCRLMPLVLGLRHEGIRVTGVVHRGRNDARAKVEEANDGLVPVVFDFRQLVAPHNEVV